MAKPIKFVVGFNGARDSYQVPLALEEDGRLAGLVTDLYLGEWQHRWPFSRVRAFERRTCEGLPAVRAHNLILRLAADRYRLRHLHHVAEQARIYARIDATISRSSLRLAEKHGAGLFLYGGYAAQAFGAPAAKKLAKVLFVFHPHGGYVRPILEADAVMHREIGESHRQHLLEIEMLESDRIREEIELADLVITASTFTYRSVAPFIGQRPTAIVPYGCFAEARPNHETDLRPPGAARFLYVGQGVQRKGLHHLLKAWRQAGKDGAELTVVTSHIDPGLRTLVGQAEIRLLRGLTGFQLQAEYRRADFLVMPSLVEGFGLVYLEALAAGCCVIGTANTGLPDLHLEPHICQLVEAGNVDQLAAAIEEARRRVLAAEIDRSAAQQSSARFPWTAFRAGIRESLSLLK